MAAVRELVCIDDATEFDTFQNGWDPNANHIAIQSNGTGANTAAHNMEVPGSATVSVVNSTLSSNTVVITYDGSSTLTATLDGVDVVSAPVNLSTLLSLDPGGNAVLGFTLATGADGEVTQILSWSFTSN